MGDKPASDIQTDSVGKTACNQCGHVMDLAGVEAFSTVECPQCHGKFAAPGRLGSLVLLKLLGKGEMGATYKAYEKGLNRNVAVKVMRCSLGEDRKRVDAFFDEARAVASLEHPNTVRLYSAGEEKGQPYLVMELIKGKGMDRAFTADQPMEEAEALEIGIGVAKALAAAGAIGLVHGDIKPANIMLDEKGTPKLVDFGIARFGGGRAGQEQIVGTPYYVAPEQVRREPVDWRADEYSLGATLFHAMAGAPPFPGTSVQEVLHARLNGPAPSLSTVRPGVHPKTAAVLARMLEAEPDNRHATYRELLDDLQQAYFQVTGLHTPEMQEVVGRPVIPMAQRVKTPWHWIIVGVAAAVVGLAVAVWAIGFRGDRTPRIVASTQQAGPAQVAGPVFTPPAQTLADVTEVQITCQDAGAAIHFTVDASEPTEASPTYEKPVAIKPGTTLRARAFRQGQPPSRVADALYASDVTTVAEAVPAQTAAQKAWERAAKLDGGQGLAARIEACETLRTNADKYYAQKAYGLALTAYKDLSARCAALEALDQQRRTTAEARNRARSTVAAMEELGGKSAADAPWVKADEAAAAAFESGDFSLAAKHWGSVDGLVAGRLAHLLVEARQGWERAEKTANVPLLMARAGGVWQETLQALAQARQAEKADQPVEAARKYRQATVLVGRAAEVAKNTDIEARWGQLLNSARALMDKQEYAKALDLVKQAQAIRADGQVAEMKRRIEERLHLVLDIGDGRRLQCVWIPPGKFQMGSPETEPKRGPSERQHEVTLTRPFYMSVYEVKHSQFQQFLKERGQYKTEAERGGGAYVVAGGRWVVNKDARWDKTGFSQNDQHPVTCVSWNDAREFCRWASEKTRRKVRLPTEAEWEYACRAGATGAFSFGDNEDDLAKNGNYADEAAKLVRGEKGHSDGAAETAQVGKYAPNAWGLFDMHGNVMEWCEDIYGGYPAGAVSDPHGPDKGKIRVVRGGAWDKPPSACRSAARASFPEEYRAGNLGFRVVVE